MPLGDQPCQRRCRAQRDGIFQRHGILQGGDAVQVRVDGDQPVELAGQQLAKHPLADYFTGIEGDVLAHVGQIRRDQDQSPGAQSARLAGDQEQLDQLLVGMVEAAVDHQLLGDGLAFAQWQTQAQFVIGKTVALDCRGGQPRGFGQPQGGGALVIEIQQLALHRHSRNGFWLSGAADLNLWRSRRGSPPEWDTDSLRCAAVRRGWPVVVSALPSRRPCSMPRRVPDHRLRCTGTVPWHPVARG